MFDFYHLPILNARHAQLGNAVLIGIGFEVDVDGCEKSMYSICSSGKDRMILQAMKLTGVAAEEHEKNMAGRSK
ncbi:hypothetical protein DUT91_17705 [Phyllobacterium salinisoli]|uniref:Uncharacterized protein n=1 Tax=Phyllobacterium salinisoli TaxID=1899321 RepID=A0A368K2S9_9HYPH|nr:hypothetical protein [Phyllobacterium salinisoli]RCS22702.1 hypothetical protein DUT91_17705 [Phyllobacterium salinisoli]